MRFFTDCFFSDEQKVELLGGKYASMRRSSIQVEQEMRSRAIELAQAQEYQRRQQDEFDNASRRVERIALPLVLVVLLAFGFVLSYLLDGML